jgi:hypothetical protein
MSSIRNPGERFASATAERHHPAELNNIGVALNHEAS